MELFHLLTFIFLFGLAQSGIIGHPSPDTELNAYTDRVRIIYGLLAEECPDWRQHDIQKRDVDSSHHLDVEKRLYEKLMDELIKCRDRSRPRPTEATKTPTTTIPTTTTSTKPTTTTTTPTPTTTSTTPTTTTPTTTTPTTTTTTTTANPQPIECQTAVNFTGSWRLDHAGQNLKAGGPHSADGYACDLQTRVWFRFRGDGGSRMLDRCAPWNSCGTNMPMWSNGTMPVSVGERVETRFYWRCSPLFSERLSVIRCSGETDDLIYQQHHDMKDLKGTCREAFCGMN